MRFSFKRRPTAGAIKRNALRIEGRLRREAAILRLKVTFQSEHPITLPIHYHPILQGVLYSSIQVPALRDQLHGKGFSEGQRPAKLFTFSRLEGHYELHPQSRTITFDSPVEWTVSSAVDDLATHVASGLLKAPSVTLGSNAVEVRHVQMEGFRGTARDVQIRLLSPVTTYRTEVLPGGRKYTHYISPWDPESASLIKRNLAFKASALGQSCSEQEVGIRLIPIGEPTDRSEKVVMFKSTPIRVWDGDFRLAGDPYFIKLAWDAGIGGKSSEGFGCFETLSNGR